MALTINGKQYDEEKISVGLKNVLITRQDLIQSKTKMEIELEKIDVLIKYYNEQIEKLVKKETPIEDKKESK